VPLDPERLTRKIGKEQLELLIDKYGLDDPVMVQYGNWLGQVADGNLGWSKTAQAPVVDGFKQRLPVTLELAVLAAAPMLLVAIWMGVQSAVHQNEWPDHVLRLVTIAGSSLPLFVFGIFALMIFYGALDWFPPGRLSLWAEEVVYGGTAFTQYTGLVTVDAVLNRRLDIFTDALRHLILPVITLSYVSWAVLLRVTRTSMLETLRQDYITTARAKGVREHDVYFTHARRNAMIPVTTLSVNSLVGLLLGVFVTETIYNIKGLGHWGVQSASLYDVPAILGITLFATSLIVLGNLAADILYARLDPRIRY
jgi:ABC-type dipeptide/oligopeptide/nickel transport system permease component